MKKLTQKEKILVRLRVYGHRRTLTGRWVHFSHLNSVCYRYGARIYDLRRDGHNIEKKRVKDVWFYRLVEAVPNNQRRE